MACTNLVEHCHCGGNGFRQALIGVAERMAVPPALPRRLGSPLIHIFWGGTGLDQKHFTLCLDMVFWHAFCTSLVALVSARQRIWTFSSLMCKTKSGSLLASQATHTIDNRLKSRWRPSNVLITGHLPRHLPRVHLREMQEATVSAEAPFSLERLPKGLGP